MDALSGLRQTSHAKYATAVTGFVLAASIAAACSDRKAAGDHATLAASFITKAREWLMQSQQDSDVRFKVEHIIYAQAYLDAARSIASDVSIERASKIHIRAFVKQLEKDYDAAMRLVRRKSTDDVPVNSTPRRKPISIV